MLCSATHVLQALAWTLVCRACYRPVFLGRDPKDVAIAQQSERMSYYGMGFYTICAVLAIWIPHVIAGVITAIWIVWLVYGIRLRTSLADGGAD